MSRSCQNSGFHLCGCIQVWDCCFFVYFWAFFIFSDTLLVIFLLTIYSLNTLSLSSSAIFWLYNGVYFSFIQVFHGLIIPWPIEGQKLTISAFFSSPTNFYRQMRQQIAMVFWQNWQNTRKHSSCPIWALLEEPALQFVTIYGSSIAEISNKKHTVYSH